VLLKNIQNSISPNLSGQLVDFLAKRMTDSNKHTVKSSVQFCALFLETTQNPPAFSKVFQNGVVVPLKDKNADVRFYCLRCLDHLINSDIKHYKFYLSQFSVVKEGLLDMLCYLSELVSSDVKYI
jgi:hypothetical protein